MFIVRREPHNPLLAPRREHPWEALAVFNPSVIRTPEGVRMYYRALSNPAALVSPYAGQSTIGEAFSEDDIHFHSRRQVLMPQESWEAFGCEDPRATIFEGVTYLSYTALGGYPFNAENIKVAIAVSRDGKDFTERHLATPFNAKAFALFPERVNGKVAALLAVHTDNPPSEICLVLADEVEDFWSPEFWKTWYTDWKSHAVHFRRDDRDHVEVGAPPIKTDAGWLFFYSYIEDYFGGGERVFSVEAALLDLKDPAKIISRTESILVPEEIYEEYGIVPNIVFPTSVTTREGGMLDLWYGAADTTCAKASIRLADLLDVLSPATSRALTRPPENPILSPQGSGFESRDVFNAAAVDLDGTVRIFYRAMDEANTSTIGLAESKDGIHIDNRLGTPVYAPRADFEAKHGSPTGNSGCEDPRTVIIDERIYMTYTAYDGVNVPRGAVSSITLEDFRAKRFEAWSTPFLLTPDNVDDKDLALLPEKVNGNFLLYHRIGNRICADLLPDLTSGKRVSRCIEILGPRHGMWDGKKIGMAGPPIKTEHGYLLIYHGVSRHGTYRLGAALLDHSGLEVLSRSADPLFEPETAYEKVGEVGNVVFSCGQVVRGDTLFLYYGGADRVIGVATGSLSRILKSLSV
ncbi:MAG TPA: hypothetical protein VM103_00280 [Candidatus Paceibacterota bacterium]|nr:hypothetical protein [Candidatus Paceibacterota bacterium]